MHRPRQGMLKIYAKIMPFKEVVIQTLCYIYLYFWDAGLTIKTHTHTMCYSFCGLGICGSI